MDEEVPAAPLSFGKYVAALRGAAGLRQEDLSRLTGLSTATVARLEQDRMTGLNLKTLCKLTSIPALQPNRYELFDAACRAMDAA